VEEAAASRRTTRDVLHLDRAPRRDVIVVEPEAPAGLALVDRDSLGELGVVVVVSTLTGKDNLGLQAGDGWVKDTLYRFEPPGGGEGVTQWETYWDTPAEAADFEYALARGLTERYAGKPFAADGTGERVLGATDRIYRLVRREGLVRVRVAPPGLDRPIEPPKAPPTPKKTAKPPK
jgi:hypothetical protein